jgi:hypothetical protein
MIIPAEVYIKKPLISASPDLKHGVFYRIVSRLWRRWHGLRKLGLNKQSFFMLLVPLRRRPVMGALRPRPPSARLNARSAHGGGRANAVWRERSRARVAGNLRLATAEKNGRASRSR